MKYQMYVYISITMINGPIFQCQFPEMDPVPHSGHKLTAISHKRVKYET